jgi:hypothetical protein
MTTQTRPTQNTQVFQLKFFQLKLLPLAAIGMLLPTAYFWLFLWCLHLNIRFWMLYALLYSGMISASFFLSFWKLRHKSEPLHKGFNLLKPQFS